MFRTIVPAAPASNPVTAASGRACAAFFAIPRRLWRRHRYRAGLRAMLRMGPHLIADSGMTMEVAEQEANAPFWQSPHVPPLRLF